MMGCGVSFSAFSVKLVFGIVLKEIMNMQLNICSNLKSTATDMAKWQAVLLPAQLNFIYVAYYVPCKVAERYESYFRINQSYLMFGL